MTMYQNFGQRPAIATFFGLTSLLWAIFMLGWVFVVVVFALLIGGMSWLGGPVVGAVGTAIGAVIAVYCVLSSLLSFLLLWAGWLILRGDPRGVTLLRTWAWISLIYDAVILLMSGGFTPTSWGAMLYAVAILYLTRPVEIDQRWIDPDGRSPYHGKPKFTTDPDF